MFALRDVLDKAEDSAKVLHGGKAHSFGDAGDLDDRFLQESAGLFLSTFRHSFGNWQNDCPVEI